MFKVMKQKIFLAVLAVCFFLAASQVQAYISETPLSEELGSPEWQAGSHAFNNVSDIVGSLSAMIVGTGDEEVDSQLGFSALDMTSGLIAAMYAKQPASSVEYFADLGRRLDLTPPVFAQGTGFRGLQPILPIWRGFRNVAYLFFTVIFVLIGFAVMFRLKLNPQTVISIQNAIPRVIIALLLVTFSYAIAGFLVDLIYILIGLGVQVLAPIGGLDVAEQQARFNVLGFGEGIGMIFGGIAGEAWALFAFPAMAGGLISLLTLSPIALAVGVGVSALLFLILGVIALWVILKLFFSLLKCYISIILAIIFAPLQIMLGAIPGVQMGFGAWLRGLIANLAVFPAVALFMLLALILTSLEGPTWTPPVISSSGQWLVAIIGFGMLLMVHKIPDMVKEVLGVKPFPYGAAIGETVKPIVTAPWKAFVTAGTIASTWANIRGEPAAPGAPAPPEPGVPG